MRAVFLGLLCLSFPGPMTWGHHPEGEPPKEGFKIENLGLGFSFQEIPAGSFMMGSPLNEHGRDEDEGPVEVTISKPFEMMTTEVTQRQWFEIMKDNPSYFNRPKDCGNHHYVTTKFDKPVGLCPDHPVESVSYSDAKEFIEKLNYKFIGSSSCIYWKPQSPPAKGCYRLPTEAEWEWAARAGTETAYFFGDDSSQLGGYAVYGGNSDHRTHEVTTGWHNPNKLHGMYGNVWEWVEDSYKKILKGGKDPFNGSDQKVVCRGGSWYSYAKHLRSANRDQGLPWDRNYWTGFRLVRTL